MVQGGAKTAFSDSSLGFRLSNPLRWLPFLTVALLTGGVLKAQEVPQTIDDMTRSHVSPAEGTS